MAENLNLKTVNTVDTRPFKRLVMTIGELPTSFIESMTYYELLAWFVNYLETVIIPTVNNNAEATKELQDLFTELKNFVDNYFDNLDVQEEINNKLDEMAENGELENIIRLYIDREVEYIFPKFWANQPSQDCCLIKGYNKNICIDSGSSTNWTNIQAMLLDNSVTHLDYFILSHYDSDHVGNVNNMISNGYIDSDTIVYLPVVPDRFPAVQTTETTVKATLTANNISFSTPTEGQKLEINDDFSITFGNLNKEYMEVNYNNYNYTSMVCLINHKNTITFYAGDAGNPTYTYLDSINFINRTIELYKQGHHGIDLPANTKFIKRISPRYVVQVGGITDFGRGIYQSGETSILVSLGSLIYPTYINNDYVTFVSNGYNILNKKGVIGSYSNYMPRIDLYVDASASSNTIQDGSSTYPFEEINQALGYINGLSPSTVYINCADGNYNIETNEVDNISFINGHNITINGNNNDASSVVIGAVTVFNSNIIFNHVTLITSNTDPVIRANSSQIALTGCILTSETKRDNAVIAARGSNIYFNDTTINNFTNVITLYMDSHAIFDNLTLTNVDKIMGVNNGCDQFVPIKVTTTGTNQNDIDYNFSNFKKLIIFLEDKDNTNRQSVMTIDNPTNQINYNTLVSTASNSAIYLDNVDIRLRNNHTIYLDIQTRLTISKSDGTITVSDIQGTYIVKQALGLFNI